MSTEKKPADYFTAEVTPYGDTGGPIDSTTVTPMQYQNTPPANQYQNNVRIPQGNGYPIPNPVDNLDQQMALQLANQNAQALSKAPDMYQQAVALDGASEYPMGPTIEINRGNGIEAAPAGREPAATAMGQQQGILKDQFGNPVTSGNGNVIGLPTQNPAFKAPAGGKGSNATVQSAVEQLTGVKQTGGK